MINLRCAIIHSQRNVIHQVVIGGAEVGKQDARHACLPIVLECRKTPPADGPAANRRDCPSASNDEPHSDCECKENVENTPIAFVQPMEEVLDWSNHQMSDYSRDTRREWSDSHV